MADVRAHALNINNGVIALGPTQGFCDATTSTTTEYVDLSDWIGRPIRITCETADHYISFGDVTSFTMDVDAATLGSEYVAMPVTTTAGYDCVVPTGHPFLGYRTISGTGIIRVHIG